MLTRILVRWPGIKPRPGHWKHQVLFTGLPGRCSVLPFRLLSICKIMQYLSSSLWIISLSMLPSRFFYVIANMTFSNKHGLVYFTTWITAKSSMYYPFTSQIESYLDLTEYLYSKIILFWTIFRYFCFGIIALYVLFHDEFEVIMRYLTT